MRTRAPRALKSPPRNGKSPSPSAPVHVRRDHHLSGFGEQRQPFRFRGVRSCQRQPVSLRRLLLPHRFLLWLAGLSADLYEPPRAASAYDDPRTAMATVRLRRTTAIEQLRRSPRSCAARSPARPRVKGGLLRAALRLRARSARFEDRLRAAPASCASGCAQTAGTISEFRAQGTRGAGAGAAAVGSALRSDDRPVLGRDRRCAPASGARYFAYGQRHWRPRPY